MKLVVDTSAISVFARQGDVRLDEWFKVEHELLVPLVVVGELRAGFLGGTKQADNERLLQRFLDAANVSTLGITDMTTGWYARIVQQLKAAGRPIGTNDIWIAAMALEHNCMLLTLDADFQHIDGLELAKLS